MTKLNWNAIGDRRFETGVDRGVLYLDGTGVVWNGLLTVTESVSGGDVSAYYIDGIKFLDVISAEEFQATLEAYTYPDEFGDCDGSSAIGNGLFATQQNRRSFDFCYRTLLGNDVDGIDHGYKIHLIYNAKVAPGDKSYKSVGESTEPDNFSWKIVAKPVLLAGIKPTPHFIINSLDTPADLLATIEGILYGSTDADARLPSIGELMTIFTNYEASVFDAGHLTEAYFATFDAGFVGQPYTSTIDGGTP